MGKLDRASGYLSGGMECVADNGVGWRKKFRALSREVGLKIDYVDPTDKPGPLKIGENKQYQIGLQKSGKFRELADYVRSYRRHDLRFVDGSDFLVVSVDPDIPQWGTADEVYFAESQHKPMLFICKGGLYTLPRWLFDVIEIPYFNLESNVFENVESVVEHLKALDTGQFPMSDKWILYRKYLEESRDF